MYTILGNYPYGAISPSDPTKTALGFNTKEEAYNHCTRMNNEIKTYDNKNSTWNKNFWSEKPKEWILITKE